MNDTAVKFPISSAYEYNTIKKDGTPWQPRLFRRAPWLGLVALLGALIGVLAGAIVLYISNGKPITDWSIKPTVYLAICSAFTNILVHFSFTQAMSVAWWKRALQTDATIADLHRSWDHGQNLGAALTSGRHFGLVALASILVALAPVNGPLLQRASQIDETGETERMFNAKIDIATEIPEGYAYPNTTSQRIPNIVLMVFVDSTGYSFTGYTSGQDHMPVLLTPDFTYIVLDWNSHASIQAQYETGCWGSCISQISGAGFFTDCVNSTSPFRLPSSAGASTARLSQSEEFDPSEYGTDIFATEFVWAGGKFHLNVQYKESNDCGGSLVVRNCTFNPAIMMSIVTIDNEESVRSVISQTIGTTASDDTLVRLVELAPDSGGSNTKGDLNTSTYGGLFKAVQDAYTSSVHLSRGSSGYQVSAVGSLGNLFWGMQEESPNFYGKRSELPGLDCSMSFRDPTEYIKNGVRDLMFRTAMYKTPPFRNFDQDPLKPLDEDRIPAFIAS
ncbi:MAG: hypothetical protein Q9183_003817 [Haloplaca sp. 2 TL-2023]